MSLFKNSFVRGRVIVCILLIVMVACLAIPALAAENTEELPHVGKWKNGTAFTADGVLLFDTWAKDDTGVSEKTYVLLSEGGTELMRVNKYPEDITDGDTTPCVKHSLTFSLNVPNGTTGKLSVYFASDAAEYIVYFSEADDYTSSVDVYPGTYKIDAVDGSVETEGTYTVSNIQEVNASADSTFSLDLVLSKDNTSNEVPPTTTGTGEKTDAGEQRSSELLRNTIKLVVAVVVLIGAYGFIKWRRARSESQRG